MAFMKKQIKPGRKAQFFLILINLALLAGLLGFLIF